MSFLDNRVYMNKYPSILMAFALSSPLCIANADTYNWTGAYGGVNLGAVWTGSQLTANNINFLTDSGTYSQAMNSASVNPGLQLGYLYQFNNGGVVGMEGDFTYPDASSTYTNVNSTGSAFDQFKTQYNLQGSLRLRGGYAFDRFLPYVTAGVSFAGMKLSYNNDVGDSYSKSTTQTGWVLGAGLEYGFLKNLSGRVEYLYSGYGNALNMSVPTTVDDVSDPLASTHATMYTNVLRAAVNYRF